MRRLSGQAARVVWRLLHAALTVAIALAVVGGALVVVLAWRLSQGPIALPWLTQRVAAAASEALAPDRVTIGAAALAWQGFRQAFRAPVVIRLSDVTIADPGGRRLTLPVADATFALAPLLRGRIEPRVVILERPDITVLRAADGALRLGGTQLRSRRGPAAETGGGALAAPDIPTLFADLARPETGRAGAGAFGALRGVHVIDAAVSVIDRQLGVTWHMKQANLDLMRGQHGGLSGDMHLALALGAERAHVAGSFLLPAGGSEARLRLRMSAITPARLAGLAPSLAWLAAVNVPLDGAAEVMVGPDLALRHVRLQLHAGTGTLPVADGTLPIVDATLVAAGTENRLELQSLRVRLPGYQGGPSPVFQVHGIVQRGPGRIGAALAIDLNEVPFAALPLLWPEGVGGGARPWVLHNVTSGLARDGHFEIALAATPDLSDVRLVTARGSLRGEDLTVHWLQPVPPVVHGQALLRVLDPDTVEIDVQSGRQSPEPGEGGGHLVIRDGRMRVTGIMHPDQDGRIAVELAGPLPDALALLRDPALQLLSRHPVPLNDPKGRVDADVTVSLPLVANLSMEQVAITTSVRLTGVHLSDVAAGKNLDQGDFRLDADTDGLTLKGTGKLGDVAAEISGRMDFRAGPPTQILQKIALTARPDAAQLAAVGLDTGGLLTGPVALRASIDERRDGTGTIGVDANLTEAKLDVAPLGWRKPSGVAARLTAELRMRHDRITAIAPIRLDGQGLAVRADAEFAGGRLSSVQVDRFELGRTVAHGTIRVPRTPDGGPFVVTVTGDRLDLAARLTRKASQTRSRASSRKPARQPPWRLDAHFRQVLLAHGETLTKVALQAEHDGSVFRNIRMDGLIGGKGLVQLVTKPDRDGRAVSVRAADAGALLRGLDLIKTIRGGQLTVTGHFAEGPDAPLTGTAELDAFRLRDAPAMAKLLKAVTLYGVVDLLRGPGLRFSRLIAPFRLSPDRLDIFDARAFSPSLGLTAKGSIAFDPPRLDMQGTIVPAYFFNSLLGHVPLVGKLFSPERGGGVFAADYTARGRLADPDVSVNPLSALTPGFLRGLFNIF